ncbi:hypothetical protein EVB32_187 [Rhizobium phage RHph_TM39]|uniref:Uncharacterized protein n=1 Tax=Rhizobium phage RHph_Y65 TaxID=2509785 RepID=A0A7S5R7Y4_9CAUD|nr:hypothetical protein PQC17_gp197 [Rhizobium phage RHph_Y65]QIG72030.1 hypothetical protein EVB95_196 [Rhizobium phage RHph_TM2_3B]QIG72393.1 hypothetical protein EVB96_197 [Rhizobium phage RHph_TM3_3_6]QIG72755.1 hypothetical protein EVB97_197 [Rhizobium phage RHph_Y65]QIG77175.1 hypothetical protein EVB32_187 [Rhizobium phage RHph_TM39]
MTERFYRTKPSSAITRHGRVVYKLVKVSVSDDFDYAKFESDTPDFSSWVDESKSTPIFGTN